MDDLNIFENKTNLINIENLKDDNLLNVNWFTSRGEYGNTPLHKAVLDNDLSLTKTLLSAGHDVNAIDNFDDTPLTIAVRERYLQIAVILLEHNANANHFNSFNETALHVAAELGDVDIVEVLLLYGAKPNKLAFNGETPLFRAYENKNTEVVDILVNSGANMHFHLNNGLSRFDHVDLNEYQLLHEYLEQSECHFGRSAYI